MAIKQYLTIEYDGDHGVVTYYQEPDGNRRQIPKSLNNGNYVQLLDDIENGIADILPVIPPEYPNYVLRERAYDDAGVTKDEMIVALYEKIVEGKTDKESGITAMQVKRIAVKAAIDK